MTIDDRLAQTENKTMTLMELESYGFHKVVHFGNVIAIAYGDYVNLARYNDENDTITLAEWYKSREE